VKPTQLVIAAAILLAVTGAAFARHVTHSVTPDNIKQQPFSFTLTFKDAGELMEFAVTVKQKPGGRPPASSASGSAVVDRSGRQEAAFPTVTKVDSDGVQTYTFQIPRSVLDRARFTFTESPSDAEFPNPGDYWVFNLADFADPGAHHTPPSTRP